MVFVGVLVAILGLIAIVYSRLITTFVHELGHAIPALLFTENDVHMYVGSYGDLKKSKVLKFGNLYLIVSLNIWALNLGMVCHSKTRSKLQEFIVITSGPLLSLILGGIFISGIISWGYSDGVKFCLGILAISSIFDFFINIIPREEPMELHDGRLVYNDGQQMLNLFRKRNLPEEYFQALELKKDGKLEQALVKLHTLDNSESKNKFYIEEILDIYFAQNNINAFLDSFSSYISRFDPLLKYVSKWAEIKIKLHEYDDVVQKLTKILYSKPNLSPLIFQRGKALIELSEYREAMVDFQTLTLQNEKNSRALAYRAYCQFKLGYFEEANEDIRDSLLNEKKATGEMYFLAGLIFTDKDPELALMYFKNAKELEFVHHALDFNISQLEGMD